VFIIDIESLVVEFCSSKLNTVIVDSKIENCYRVGKNFNKPRPVLVRFSNYKIKSKIFKNVGNLKGTNYAISDDLSPAERIERSKFIKYKIKAHKLNLRARLFKNGIMIEGVKYALEDLEDPELLDRIKSSLLDSGGSHVFSDSDENNTTESSTAAKKRGRESPNNSSNSVKEPRLETSAPSASASENNYTPPLF
jgi:hypothetical protein